MLNIGFYNNIKFKLNNNKINLNKMNENEKKEIIDDYNIVTPKKEDITITEKNNIMSNKKEIDGDNGNKHSTIDNKHSANKNIKINDETNNNKSENNFGINIKKSNTQKTRTQVKKEKLYTIKETESKFYIENNKKSNVMVVEKNSNKLYQLKDLGEMQDLIPMKLYRVDSILGIIDLIGKNKYILVVSSSHLIVSILGGEIYNILDVHLIKITHFNESEIEKNRIVGIKKLFQTKNFYYSNEIDLSSNNIFAKNKKNIITDYCVNTSLLKYYFDNLISNDFYSKIIYGYIGFKKNNEIENNNNKILFGNLIIERVNKHLTFDIDIINQIKEIEFICIYKYNDINNTNKKNNINIYSFKFYVSNEISNSKIDFNPWNNFIIEQLSRYKNIVCIINNNLNSNLKDNIIINNGQIGNIIFNTNTFGQKVKLLNFTSDWKQNLYFDSFNNSNIYIKNGIINSNVLQEYIFWLIDINNFFLENDCCFNTIIRIMWKSIQQQFELMNLEIDIGEFNNNNNGTFQEKFKELISNYQKDFNNNKKSLYKSKLGKQLQKLYDFYFNSKNINKKNKNDNINIILNKNLNKNNQKNNINKESKITEEKLSILCITWNVGGIPSDNKYDINNLFTKNIFHKNKQFPDIIIIGFEEIVKLDFYSILTITTNEDSTFNWTQNISFTINELYPHIYTQFISLDLIGIFCICFIKTQLKDKIELISKNVIKTGLFGTLGNKGYVTFSLRYNNENIISIAHGHLEAGQNTNKARIDTLKQILDTKINNFDEIRFRNSDFWIILGDLNFRIDTSFEIAYKLIQNKKYKDLIRYDQFYVSCKRDKEMAIVTEGIINFAPTYKYVQGSNNYLNDSNNMRIPSYCDRVLFSNCRGIKNIEYKNISSLMESDHRPVYACFEIDILEYNNIPNNNMINMNKDKNNNDSENNINNFDDYYNNKINDSNNENKLNNKNDDNENNLRNSNIRNIQNNNNFNRQINNNIDIKKNNNQKNNYFNSNNDFNTNMRESIKSNHNNSLNYKNKNQINISKSLNKNVEKDISNNKISKSTLLTRNTNIINYKKNIVNNKISSNINDREPYSKTNNNSGKKLNQNDNNIEDKKIEKNNDKEKKEEEMNKKKEQENKSFFNYFNIESLKKYFQ